MESERRRSPRVGTINVSNSQLIYSNLITRIDMHVTVAVAACRLLLTYMQQRELLTSYSNGPLELHHTHVTHN